METLDNSIAPVLLSIIDFATNSVNLVILLIIIQTGFLIIMVVYVIFLRKMSIRKEVWLKQKHEAWYEAIFAFMVDEITAAEIGSSLDIREYRQFGDFIKGFLLDIAGEDKEKISHLLREIHYPSYLLEKINDKNVEERSFALYFMGLMDCTRYAGEIREMLDDDYQYNRFLAASVLMQVKDFDSIRLIFKKFNTETYFEYSVRLTTIISNYGADMLPEVLDIFKSIHLTDWLKLVCIRLFRIYVYFEAQVDILACYNETTNQELQYECLKALKSFENPDLVGFFEDQLEAPNFTVKQISASALGMLAKNSSLVKLEKLLFINNFWVLKRVVEAISEFGAPGLKILKSHVNITKNELCKGLIIEALQQS